jgi:hypothetical protein
VARGTSRPGIPSGGARWRRCRGRSSTRRRIRSNRIRRLPIFMTEGTGATPSLEGSRVLARYMRERGFRLRVPRGGRQPRRHGADGVAADLRVLQSPGDKRRRRLRERWAPGPQEIRLWPGKAPGSERWTVPEATTTSPAGDRTITNVSDPTVTVFLPPPPVPPEPRSSSLPAEHCGSSGGTTKASRSRSG